MQKLSVVRLAYVTGIILLFVTLFYRALVFQFDADELQNAQKIYLISTGYIPYRDFFSVYPALLHLFFVPVFRIIGFTFAAITAARTVMFLLYLGTVWLLYRFVSRVFTPLVAAIWIFLYGIEPFTQFASWQLRVDNPMMTLFAGGLLASWYGLNGNRRVLFLAGFLWSLSVLVGIKIAPLVVWFGIGEAAWLFWHKKPYRIIPFAAGVFIPVAVCTGILMYYHAFPQAIRQIFFDGPLTNATRMYPPILVRWFEPRMYEFFGGNGRTVSWFIANIMPFLGAMGFLFLMSFVKLKSIMVSEKTYMRMLLVVSFFIGWVYLFHIHAVFVHYFLVTSWISTLGGAYVLWFILRKSAKHRIVMQIIWAAASALFVIGVYGGVRANMVASSYSTKETVAMYRQYWSVIPKGAFVFPGMLFRPPGHFIPYGYFYPELPDSIRSRYPSIPETLKGNRVSYVIANTYFLGLLDGKSAKAITSNFHPVSPDSDIWIRNGK